MDHRCGVSVVHVGGADAAGGATPTRNSLRSDLDVDERAISSRRCRSSSTYEA